MNFIKVSSLLTYLRCRTCFNLKIYVKNFTQTVEESQHTLLLTRTHMNATKLKLPVVWCAGKYSG